MSRRISCCALFLTFALAAPAWMQILHLLAAQLLWIAAFTSWLGIREREA